MRVTCKNCNHKFTSRKTFWNETGYGYSSKLARCPECGCITVVKIIEDYAVTMMGDLGLDPRYYEYDNQTN